MSKPPPGWQSAPSDYLSRYKPYHYGDQAPFYFMVVEEMGTHPVERGSFMGIDITMIRGLAGPACLAAALKLVQMLRNNSLPENRHKIKLVPAWRPQDFKDSP